MIDSIGLDRRHLAAACYYWCSLHSDPDGGRRSQPFDLGARRQIWLRPANQGGTATTLGWAHHAERTNIETRSSPSSSSRSESSSLTASEKRKGSPHHLHSPSSTSPLLHHRDSTCPWCYQGRSFLTSIVCCAPPRATSFHPTRILRPTPKHATKTTLVFAFAFLSSPAATSLS